MDKLIKKIRDDKSHASIPFWSWNDKLEEEELRRQIRNMKQLGMRGFFMHARGGLETEYLSKEWFNCVRICIDEAKKSGLEAWAYDENGWPSGFAGGELMKNPKNRAAFISYETVVDFPEKSDDILGVYSVSDKGATRLSAPDGSAKYAVIHKGLDFAYVNVLDSSVTKQFIEITHEAYKTETGNDFGNAMPGFFTDEPQYFRWGTPWSDNFFTDFTKRFGYDVLDGLPALFVDYEGAEEFRYDYHLFLHECYINNFIKLVFDWCEKNGVKLTGHGVEEWGLGGQMMACGGIMPFYRYQHIPGIDYLGRGIQDITGIKQLGSVCEQLGKQYRLSEMFAGCGWNITPLELKRIADLQFAGGVNLICEHLYAYSERGQRKRDYPNHYSEHNPWQDEYKDFETHYTHLGSLLSQGKEIADTLVLHPIHSAYLNYKHNDFDTVSKLDRKYTELSEALTFAQIPFHYADETILRDLGKVVGDTVCIGNCRYDKVIIPFCYTLDSTTVDILKQYLKNGGKLLLWENCPDRIDGRKADLSFISSNITYDDIKQASCIKVTGEKEQMPIFVQARASEQGRIFFLVNPSDKTYRNTEITVKNCKGLTLLDPLTLNKEFIRGKENPDGSVTVLFDFGDSASLVLLEEKSQYLPFIPSKQHEAISIKAPFKLASLPENMLILDQAEISLNGGDFSKPRPISRIRDNLLSEQFKGDVTLRFRFNTEVIPQSLTLVIEPMRYSKITVNGQEIQPSTDKGRIDRRFLGADIARFVKLGENEVIMTFNYYQEPKVYETLNGKMRGSMRNCLFFATEIEEIYLYGDFGVKAAGGFYDGGKPDTYRGVGPFVLTARNRDIDLSDIVRNGYPFFAGEMTAETTLSYKKGDPTLLRLNGCFAVCSVQVNGEKVCGNIFSREFDLSDFVKVGENTLRLTVKFSNRNLLGPHHRKDPEPKGIGPTTFSFEKEWNKGDCPNFAAEPAFVKFGIQI